MISQDGVRVQWWQSAELLTPTRTSIHVESTVVVYFSTQAKARSTKKRDPAPISPPRAPRGVCRTRILRWWTCNI